MARLIATSDHRWRRGRRSPGALSGAQGAHSPRAAQPAEPRSPEPRRARARPSRRSAALIIGAARRARRRPTPLSLSEREALITDVFHELFGLGPLEALLADPTISDILVNRYDQIYVEREGKLEPTDARVQGRPAPAADHRAHRQLGRPAHRRVEPDGRRAPAGRLARQRDHPAAGARRPGAVDPPFPHRPARRATTWSSRESLTQPMLDFLAGGRRLPAEHPRLGRHRRRQDDAAERAVELHLAIASASSPSRTRPN